MGAEDETDILIVGGGIAGLALAGLLRQRGMRATIVEKATAWERVGWGIGLWGNGIAVLEVLGVAEDAVDRGSVPDRFEIRDGRGKQLASVSLPGDREFLAIHRADLHAALRQAIPQDWVMMGTTISAIDSTGDELTVTFDEETTGDFDVVVGADGIHSQVRDLQFEEWTVEDRSTVVWSFWVPPEVDIGMDGAMVSLWTRGTEVFLGEIGERSLVNIATRMSRNVTPEPPARNRLAAIAGEIGWQLPAAVDALHDDADVFFDRNREVTAERWTRDRTVMIGDAAHAVHPISGMGAALALEDAYVLAAELSADKPIHQALQRFEDRRRDRIRSVKQTAHLEEAVTFTDSPVLTRLRNAFVRWTPVTEWFLKRQVESFTSNPLETL